MARRKHNPAGWVLLVLGAIIGCSPEASEAPSPGAAATTPPSILLVTLDTTRADRPAPNLGALAARGLRFTHAYATAPMTLPAHVSMFTGLYPAEHGIRENGRFVSRETELLADRLREQGYRTAAFVSGYPLSREFGLARGFDHFDDEFAGEGVERDAGATTDRALAYLAEPVLQSERALFLWVHYFDPHEPYSPPEPFASRYPDDPYQGEIAFMDEQLGRLLAGFDERAGDSSKIVVAADHGEGLGEHGEALHGRLLYQGVMRVPLVVAGGGVPAGLVDDPVSTRAAFDTILGWAEGVESPGWLSGVAEPVLGEALKPYLQYGWQPQVMGVSGVTKVIRSGETEVYDLASDPEETRNLAGEVELDRELQQALRGYPLLPESDSEAQSATASGEALSEDAIKKLASLGYFDSIPSRELREDAPNPKDMTHVFRDLDVGSALFVREEFARAIPVFLRVHAIDPENLEVTLRLAVAHSVEGHEREAQRYFEAAREIAGSSIDLRHYHAMHYFRFGRWQEAAPIFESVLAETPQRLPALECMAQIREREGRLEEARGYLERVVALKRAPARELVRLGELSMAVQDTPSAIRAFERARDLAGEEFTHFLELGVCYLANRQLAAAASALDRVPRLHPGYPMALFKRAQVAVLRNEPDRDQRIARARESADANTRPLIEREPLFRDAGSAPGGTRP